MANRLMLFLGLMAGLILSVQPAAAQTDPVRPLIERVDQARLEAHIRALTDAGGHPSRIVYTPGNEAAVDYLEAAFRAIPGLTSVRRDTFYVTTPGALFPTRPVVNVIAELRGSRYPDSILVVGGHIDNCADRNSGGKPTYANVWQTVSSPGADDDASGLAATLELARILADPTDGYTPEYTIRFCGFNAEEVHPAYPGSSDYHHFGSSHIAFAAKARGDRILGVVQMDMIGYNKAFQYVSVISDGASEWLGRNVLKMAQLYDLPLITNRPPYPLAYYSDHEAFWRAGYPAILLMENAPPWNDSPFYTASPIYHTSGDSLGTINLPLVTTVTRAALGVLGNLARQDGLGLRPSTDVTPPTMPVAAGVRRVDDRLVFTWKPSPSPDIRGYRVLTSATGTGWVTAADEKQLGPKTTSFEATLPADGRLYFRVSAVDSVGNVSDSPSDAYGSSGAATTRVLIVDGFDRYTNSGSYTQISHGFAAAYGEALMSLGQSFDTATDDEIGLPGGPDLSRYPVVLWFLGDDNQPADLFNPAQQTAVRAAQQAGTRFIVSGSELFYAMGRSSSAATDRAFLSDVFHATYERDGSRTQTSVNGVAGTPFAAMQGVAIGQVYPEDYPDNLFAGPGAEGLLSYNDGHLAAVGYHATGAAGVVTFGFPLETVSDPTVLAGLLRHAFETLDITTAVGSDGTATVPGRHRLIGNAPNPFNPSTTIRYELAPAGGRVGLDIYDLTGALVRRLTDGEPQSGGLHLAIWDGRTAAGATAATGLYLARLTVDGRFVEARRMTLVK